MLTCPRCLQPYLRISQLINPIRTIYVHRESKGASKNPIDYCMGTQSNPSQVVDGVETKLRSKNNNKKVIASCLDGMVTSNQVRKDHDIQNLASTEEKEETKMPFVGFDV